MKAGTSRAKGWVRVRSQAHGHAAPAPARPDAADRERPRWMLLVAPPETATPADAGARGGMPAAPARAGKVAAPARQYADCCAQFPPDAASLENLPGHRETAAAARLDSRPASDPARRQEPPLAMRVPIAPTRPAPRRAEPLDRCHSPRLRAPPSDPGTAHGPVDALTSPGMLPPAW